MRQSRRQRRNGLYHRLYARLLDPFNRRYERMVGARKKDLFGELSGRVLEIGAGTGSNLKYLPPGVEWLGVDPNPWMEAPLRRNAEGFQAEFRVGQAEELPVEDDSMDAVIATLVLCSVDDPAQALSEARRVLKPGGRFVFIEHVAAEEGSRTRRRQEWICPLWRRLADGCRPNRETGRAIEEAGFDRVSYERFRINLPIAGPHIAGTAFRFPA